MKLQHDATGIDWSALIELFRLADLSGREGDKVRRAFEKSDRVVFALEGNTLVGAARALTDFEYHATIYDVVVHPTHQRRGIGTNMMQALLSSLKVWRVLLVAERQVQPFYARLGFEAYGDVLARQDAPISTTREPQNYLRHRVGVNSTRSVNTSSRPNSMAAEHTQV